MAIERTFGILKGRCRILLNWINVPLHHLLNIVTTILYLHNLCILHGDAFNMDWAREVEMEMQAETNDKLGDFQNKNMFHIACNTIK
jgi:hypothetical protein